MSGKGVGTMMTSSRLEEWRELLAAAQAFREVAPWRWLGDDPLLGIEDPVTGELGLGSVMGAAGQAFGVLVFRGATGLWANIRMTDDVRPGSWEHQAIMHHLDALTFRLGARDEVENSVRKLYRDLGYSFRGKHDWPVFCNYMPGYVLETVSGDEISLLTRYLRQAVTFAVRLRDDDILRHEWTTRSGFNGDLADDTYSVLCLVPMSAGAGGRHLPSEYGDCTLQWRRMTPESPLQIDASFDELVLASVQRRFRRMDRAWAFDVCPTPIAIGGHNTRAANVQIALCVDESSQMVIGFDMIPGLEPALPAANLLGFIEYAGYIPSEIGVTRLDVARSLVPFAKALGVDVACYSELPALEEAFSSFLANVRCRHPVGRPDPTNRGA